MSKLGPVNQDPPPVQVQIQSPQALGVVASREETVRPAAGNPGLGQIKTETVTVNVQVPGPEPIGQVRQVFVTSLVPPPPPPPVGVVVDRTPVVSATPVAEGSSRLGVVTSTVKDLPPPPPPLAVGAVIQGAPTYPPPPPVHQGNVGAVVERVVDAGQASHSSEPQKVVSIAPKAKEIIERPIEISPFRPAD